MRHFFPLMRNVGLLAPVAAWLLFAASDDSPSRHAPAVAVAAEPEPPARTTAEPDELVESQTDAQDPGQFFESHVRPILVEHCWKCHGEGKLRGGLNMHTRESFLKGGETGPAVSLDQPSTSLLLDAINYRTYEMPPTGKLSAPQIAVLTRWVQSGIPWSDRAELAPMKAESKAEEETDGPPQITEATKQSWSFRTVVRPEVPAVQESAWPRSAVDRFVLSRLESSGLQPAPEAEKAVLLRRAYYDLIGLPPTPAEVRKFLADQSPAAYERVVDRLLASPHYGEKWGRHWLDLVRFAETNSFERDGNKPFAWRYRQYVIQAFNTDKPYDQFIREQLAGDELDHVTRETLIATGYYRLGIWDDEPADPLQALYDDLDDILSTTGQVFLGLTIGCARCHDHKLDPIPQADYYRMLAFFRNVRRFGVRSLDSIEDASLASIATPEQQLADEQTLAEYHADVEQMEAERKAIVDSVRSTFTPEESEQWEDPGFHFPILAKRIPDHLAREDFRRFCTLTHELESKRKSPPKSQHRALAVKENGADCPKTHILVRGNPHVPQEEVQPAFLQVLSPPTPEIVTPAADADSCGRRRALAEWISSPENPLTARVMANRLWQYHFGRGIVGSPNNFGLAGKPPSHPALLDYLASELVAQGWRLKPLHRELMLSSTYRMSSQASSAGLAADPENNLYWRFSPRRLTAEEIRDSILAVNQSLNLNEIGGQSIYTIIPEAILAGQSRPGEGWGQSSEEERRRRSIYIFSKRSLHTPIIESFDAPEGDSTCAVRFSTTQPTQALALLNGDFLHREANVFAANILQEFSESDPAAAIKEILWRVLQRSPADDETRLAIDFYHRAKSKHGLDHAQAVTQVCVLAYNLNEFLYLD